MRRILIALSAALIVGTLAYIVGRGVAGALILREQQQLIGGFGALSGGVDGLAQIGDLRAARRALAASADYYERLAALIACIAAGIAASAAYLRAPAAADG